MGQLMVRHYGSILRHYGSMCDIMGRCDIMRLYNSNLLTAPWPQRVGEQCDGIDYRGIDKHPEKQLPIEPPELETSVEEDEPEHAHGNNVYHQELCPNELDQPKPVELTQKCRLDMILCDEHLEMVGSMGQVEHDVAYSHVDNKTIDRTILEETDPLSSQILDRHEDDKKS